LAEAILDPTFLKKLERLSLVTRRPFAGQMKGEKRSVKRGTSVEFADYREYILGDDLRYVDWNMAARLDKLFVKLFIEEEDLYLALLIDTSKSMDFGNPKKLHYAARVAAALGYIGLSNYDRVSITAFAGGIGDSLPTKRGKAGVLPFFRFLNQLKASGETSFASAMKGFSSRAKSKGVAIVLSDFLDPQWPEGLRSLLARGYQVALIHTLDEEEILPTLLGDLRIIDSESGESKEMSVNPALLGRYTAALDQFCDDLETFANRYGMDYLRTSTSMPFEDVILKYLRQGGLIK
jgi:uncharacterized protein (DUF58 family)